ncbi:MAG: hypothetical protein FJ146_02005 [Deltaproteobacteria bacterium]|nr:hypothetical protein [Deltaproteobacteria bacterium]
MKRSLLQVACALNLITAPTAFGRDIQCDKPQKYCYTKDQRLTVGDKVGIVNEAGELEAVGVVKGVGMKTGQTRGIEIEQAYGPISATSAVVLLSDHEKADYKDKYPVAQAPAANTLGLSVGYASVGSGAGIPGQELSIHTGMRLNDQFDLVGRVGVLSVQGPVRIYTGLDFTSPQLNVLGFGLWGGMRYKTRSSREFSLQTELGLGLMSAHATLGESRELNEKHLQETRFKNGYSPSLRWGLAGVYNRKSWHFDGGFAVSVVGQAVVSSLVVGATYDLTYVTGSATES